MDGNGLRKKLPIGIQTFSHIRNDNYIYVDKTQAAYELIEDFKYVFLSRPRRFGKSLFLDTLASIFEGKKLLFEELYIADKWDFSVHYPVIRISFSGELFTEIGLKQAFDTVLRNNQDRLGVDCDEKLGHSARLDLLIKKVYQKYEQTVVILIDEYDKPLLDNLTNPQMAAYAKDKLRAFYSVIKDNDAYLKFTFITGVTKFSKVSIFSGLNNLRDISLLEKYGNICGYTQSDIETIFAPYLQGVDLAELKSWYDGFNFLKDNLYNPFDILLFIDSKHIYSNYWFATGTPTFLLELLKAQNYYLPDLKHVQVSESQMDTFDIDYLEPEILLFQTGYLTIREVKPSFGNSLEYHLGIPNKEVQLSLYEHLVSFLYRDNRTKNRKALYHALLNNDMPSFKQALTVLFATLPHQSYNKNNIAHFEGYYANVIFIYLSSLGVPVTTEESTNRGRLDMSILVNNHRYILEFKVGGKANPLEQIKAKKYYQKFLNEGSIIHLIGINFDETERNIKTFMTETLTTECEDNTKEK